MITNLAVFVAGAAFAATPCTGLKSVSIPNTTITMAESVPAGNFVPPAGGGGGGQRGAQPAALAVPAFCRVAATLKPTSDSEIDMEVWLPESWNGKFQFVGGGGWAGVISYPAMASALHSSPALKPSSHQRRLLPLLQIPFRHTEALKTRVGKEECCFLKAI